MAKWIAVRLLLAGLALVVLKLVVVLLEPRLTFLPTRGLSHTPETVGVDYQEIALRTADGETLTCWSLPHPEPLADVLFFHGNGGNLSLWLDLLLDIREHRFAVFALDYRGYGNSTGSPTEAGLHRDAEAAVERFWRRRQGSRIPAIYWGRSLGGPVAAHATSIRPPDGLILEATFSSKASLLRHYRLLQVLAVFSRYRLETALPLEDFRRPVLHLHGDSDRVIPYEEGLRLFEQVRAPKRLHTVAGGGHNDLHLISPDTYWEHVVSFAKELSHGQDSH